MPKRTYSLLENHALVNYIQDNHESWAGRSRDEVAAEACQALGFDLDTAKLSSVMKEMGISSMFFRARGTGDNYRTRTKEVIAQATSLLSSVQREMGEIQDRLAEIQTSIDAIHFKQENDHKSIRGLQTLARELQTLPQKVTKAIIEHRDISERLSTLEAAIAPRPPVKSKGNAKAAGTTSE